MEFDGELAADHSDLNVSHEKRARSVKLAVIVSALSKVFGFIVQFAAIPFAVASLGPEFQIYALLATLGNLIGIANIGSGPGIAMILTEYAVRSNESEERKWFTSGLITTALSTIFIMVIALAIGVTLPMPALFGDTVIGHESVTRNGFLVMVVLATLQNTLVYFTNAYAGYLEDFKSKAAMMGGYALSIPAIFMVCIFWPNPINLAFAIFGIPILSQFYLVFTLWFKDRPYLRFSLSDWVWERGLKVFKSNVLYTLNAVGSVMAKQGSVLLLSKFGPVANTAATASILMQWWILAVSLYIMIAGSCWPSFSNAKKHGDWSWIARGLKRLTLALLVSGAIGGLLVGFLGVWVGEILFRGKEVFITPELAWLCAVIVFLGAIEVGTMFLLMAFEKMRQAAVAGLLQGALIVIGIPLMKANGLNGMMVTVIISEIVLSVASLFFLIQAVHEIKREVLSVQE